MSPFEDQRQIERMELRQRLAERIERIMRDIQLNELDGAPTDHLRREISSCRRSYGQINKLIKREDGNR
jgi:hypothetical protein